MSDSTSRDSFPRNSNSAIDSHSSYSDSRKRESRSKSYNVLLLSYSYSSSETDAILNALNSTPSVQPVRVSKGSTKNAVKRSAESNLPSSHFDKRQTTLPPAPAVSSSASFMNQPVSMPLMMPQIQQMPMSFQPVQSRPLASDWQVFKTPAGVEYYYNQRTRATTYEKPEELKSEAERSLKVDFFSSDK